MAAQSVLALVNRGPQAPGKARASEPMLQRWVRVLRVAGPSAMCQIAAMSCSNAALKHIAYPLQSLAKSCKLIPGRPPPAARV